jgi:hypothetical protein
MNTAEDHRRRQIESAEMTKLTPMRAEVVAIEFVQRREHHAIALVKIALDGVALRHAARLIGAQHAEQCSARSNRNDQHKARRPPAPHVQTHVAMYALTSRHYRTAVGRCSGALDAADEALRAPRLSP